MPSDATINDWFTYAISESRPISSKGIRNVNEGWIWSSSFLVMVNSFNGVSSYLQGPSETSETLHSLVTLNNQNLFLNLITCWLLGHLSNHKFQSIFSLMCHTSSQPQRHHVSNSRCYQISQSSLSFFLMVCHSSNAFPSFECKKKASWTKEITWLKFKCHWKMFSDLVWIIWSHFLKCFWYQKQNKEMYLSQQVSWLELPLQ